MRIEDVPEVYRDSPIVRALFAKSPTPEQAAFLDELRAGNGESRITVKPPR
jgi:hypothetical protein